MAVKVPTMSTAGWIDTPHEKASYMIACFIAANYSQSTAMYGKITTLQYLVQKYSNRLVQLENELNIVFEEKVKSVFPGTATAIVKVRQTDPDNPTIFSISLECDINIDGRSFQIGKLVQYKDSIMTKIMDIANG